MPKPKQKTSLKSSVDAERCMADLKEVTLRLTQLDVHMNQSIQSIQDLTAAEAAPLLQRKLALETDLGLYVAENKTLFEKAKTIATAYGRYGLRKLPPSVKFMKKIKVGDVVERIITRCRELRRYITSDTPYETAVLASMQLELINAESLLRTTVTLDKEAVLSAHREKMITDDELANYGLAVQTDKEEFTYTLDIEQLDA